MKQAEISVLNGLYKNAAVGKDAIFCVLEHTRTPTSKRTLHPAGLLRNPAAKNPAADENILSIPQRTGYARKGLQQCQHSPALSGRYRQPSSCKTNGGRNKHGLDSAFQLMNRHANLTDSVRKQGAEMMQQEEAYLNRLKPYL